MAYGTQHPPAQFKTKVSRGQEHIYVELENSKRIVGEVRIARGWNALGRKVSVKYFIFYVVLTMACREQRHSSLRVI
jgi:hypothetical protein